jgi:putative cardiolipin synthase
LASNNHIPVQSAYNRYRKDVINSGVDVYEINAFAARVIDTSEEAPETMTLHTKAVLIDRRFLFAGSLNLDPRSTQINTEMGLLIDSSDMVQGLVERLVRVLPKVTYKVVLNDKNNLEWHTINEDVLQVLHKEPHTSAWLRFKAWFMRIAPENQM